MLAPGDLKLGTIESGSQRPLYRPGFCFMTAERREYNYLVGSPAPRLMLGTYKERLCGRGHGHCHTLRHDAGFFAPDQDAVGSSQSKPNRRSQQATAANSGCKCNHVRQVSNTVVPCQSSKRPRLFPLRTVLRCDVCFAQGRLQSL